MVRRQKTPGEAQAGARHLVRAASWAGVRVGDPVEVEGLAMRSATWAFVAHVRNTRTGEEWVEVVGGRPGERSVRSFPPERIFPPRPKGAKAARASLADQPGLPLG